MKQRILEPRRSSVNHHVLVHFHVAHGSVLISQAALKLPFTSAEQRKLVETGVSVTQCASQEKHLQRNVVTVEPRILYGLPDFFRQFRCESFVSIDQKNPVIR